LFRSTFQADAVVINKIGVLPYFDFNLAAFPDIIGGLNPVAEILQLSVKTGEGINRWISWVEENLTQTG
jgi:hydrogenase nickel incorporation protein HypB